MFVNERNINDQYVKAIEEKCKTYEIENLKLSNQVNESIEKITEFTETSKKLQEENYDLINKIEQMPSLDAFSELKAKEASMEITISELREKINFLQTTYEMQGTFQKNLEYENVNRISSSKINGSTIMISEVF